MKLVLGRKKRGKLVVKLTIASFLVYAVALIVSQQSMIRDRKAKIDELNRKLYLQEIKNEELKANVNAENSSNLERTEKSEEGNTFGVKKNQRIFVNAKGN